MVSATTWSFCNSSFLNVLGYYKPLYRYCGHIELVRFKEYYGMPRGGGGDEHDPIYSLSIYARFSGQFFYKFSYKKIVMGKKDSYAMLGCNN